MWIEENLGPRDGGVGPAAPADVVAAAFRAFRQQDREAMLAMIDPDVEFRPVTGLGLMGRTRRGADEAVNWFDEMDQAGNWLLASPRKIEDVGDGWVLVTGTASERARAGGRFAATVAWLFKIRDGRIRSAMGYASEAEARRTLAETT